MGGGQSAPHIQDKDNETGILQTIEKERIRIHIADTEQRVRDLLDSLLATDTKSKLTHVIVVPLGSTFAPRMSLELARKGVMIRKSELEDIQKGAIQIGEAIQEAYQLCIDAQKERTKSSAPTTPPSSTSSHSPRLLG